MIRQAEMKDLFTVMMLCNQVKKQINQENIHLWGDDYPNLAIFQDDINKKSGWVEERNNQLIAYIAVSFDIDEDFAHLEDSQLETIFKDRLLADCHITKEQFCSLHRLMVDPIYQRQQVASFFLIELESILLKEQYCLFTSPDNHKAIALYQKLGYQIQSTYSFPYGEMLLLTKKVSQ